MSREVAQSLRPEVPSSDAGCRETVDNAHDALTAAPMWFEIRNRDAGQVIDVTGHGDISAADIGDVERRVLRLIAVRQPSRLNLCIRSMTLRVSTDQFARSREALASMGGVLVVTCDRGLDLNVVDTSPDGR